MPSILDLESALLNHAFEGIQLLDSSWRYQYINTTAAAQGRRSRESLLGRRMTDEYPGIERTVLFQALDRCMRERTPGRLTNLFDYPGGGSAWFELSILPVPDGVVVLSLDVSERKAAEQRLELLRAESLVDPLTGLYNRRFLTYALDRELVLANSFGILMIDVDHFKTYNDTFGHVAGDDVLRAVGRTVLACVRGSDTACRYGGDEMAVILPGATLETSSARAEEIRERIVRWTRPRNESAAASVTVSVGVAAHPGHGRSSLELLGAADRALYAAKRAGRNRIAMAAEPPYILDATLPQPSKSPPMRFKNKVVLITGAGSGIGQAAALAFSREGAKVAVADISDKSAGETVALIKKAKGKAVGLTGDVSKHDDCKRLVKETVKAFGGLDVLCNNAGIGVAGNAVTTTEQQFDDIFRVNVKGTFLLSKEALDQVFLPKKAGVIVNTASIAGLRGILDRCAYTASKHAIVGLTKAMAVDHVKDGVRVNCICPGTTMTPWIDKRLKEAADPKAALAGLVARQPMGRLGTAEEMAAGILFLAADETSFATGTALVIDGGYCA